jgi:hypothetical protein
LGDEAMFDEAHPETTMRRLFYGRTTLLSPGQPEVLCALINLRRDLDASLKTRQGPVFDRVRATGTGPWFSVISPSSFPHQGTRSACTGSAMYMCHTHAKEHHAASMSPSTGVARTLIQSTTTSCETLATTAGLRPTPLSCFIRKRRLRRTTQIAAGIFWGYTGQDYYGQNGRQMRAVKAMVDRLFGP